MNARRIAWLQHRWTAWSADAAIAAWFGVLVAGWWILQRYEYAAAAPAPRGFASQWPAASAIPRTPGHDTLLFFLHPKCPCTRASLHELEQLLYSGTATTAVDVVCVATVPEDADDVWLETDTVQRCRLLPESRVLVDRRGVEAERFGANTSGTVMLFDAAGELRYAGGVTIARGHEGDNAGRQALQCALQGETPAAAELPTFGCRLCLPAKIAPKVTGTTLDPLLAIRAAQAAAGDMRRAASPRPVP